MPASVKVLLVDDHAVVREGYRRLLERSGGIQVVGEAQDGDGALRLCRELAPHLIILDITLPGISGIETLRRLLLENPAARVLVFSMHEDAIFARRALQAGAQGYVTKASAPNVLVEAVHAIAQGRRFLSPALAQTLALADNGGANTSAVLSARELEVFTLLAQGRSVPQVADALGLTPKTVSNHQSSIKQKLGADTSIQLLRRAAELGIVPPGA